MTNNKMGTLYVGSTSDLVGRVWQHKHKAFSGFTADYDLNKLVYYEWHDSLMEMVKRERQMKEWKRNWKVRQIVRTNPTWRDLYDDVLRGAGYMPESLENKSEK